MIFGFYSSMKGTNIIDVAKVLSEGHEGIKPFEIFDSEYCSNFDENPRLRPL